MIDDARDCRNAFAGIPEEKVGVAMFNFYISATTGNEIGYFLV